MLDFFPSSLVLQEEKGALLAKLRQAASGSADGAAAAQHPLALPPHAAPPGPAPHAAQGQAKPLHGTAQQQAAVHWHRQPRAAVSADEAGLNADQEGLFSRSGSSAGVALGGLLFSTVCINHFGSHGPSQGLTDGLSCVLHMSPALQCCCAMSLYICVNL